MALSELAVRKAKPRDKAYKLSDDCGLYLLVGPNGTRGWRLKYRFAGKEQLLSLGTYPDVPLRQARDQRDEARRLLATSINPSTVRQLEKQRRAIAATDSFEAIALEWLAKFQPTWSEVHGERVKRRLEVDIFP